MLDELPAERGELRLAPTAVSHVPSFHGNLFEKENIMKRILRSSALVAAFVAAVCLTTLTPGLQSSANAYGTLSIGPGGVSYYSGYGQGYYGGYGQAYGQPYGGGYGNNGYYGYGNGTYGYGSPGVTVYGSRPYYRQHHSGPVYYGRQYGPVYSPYGYGWY